MSKKTRPSPYPPSTLGHNYCWVEHPTRGVRCTHPKGHQGAHLYPYIRPAITWK